jgi:hypothetical protein
MRTTILALAVVLLAAPVWADVTITLTDISDTVVEVGYEATGERPRAFALDLKVTEGTITDVTDFVIGDDNFGFGICPANFSRYITVNDQTGEVDDWGVPGYGPVADGGDPGAQGGLDTNGVTLEMGALYDNNAPPMTGVLCKVIVDYPTSTTLCVVGNALRGNVVLEDATEVVPVEACITLPPVGDECFPSDAAYATQYADWVRYGKPDCWCNSTATGEDISDTAPGNYESGDYQCDGDANTDWVNAFLKWRVSATDLNVVIANWKRTDANIGSGDPDTEPDPCADIDHQWKNAFLKWRVSASDLNILTSNWKKNAAALPGNCPRNDAAMGL